MSTSILDPTKDGDKGNLITKMESPEGSKTPESITGCESPGSENEDTCPICLGKVTDKCVAGSCLHRFCLVCLKEWSKQKAVCPLCKLAFDKILYDIKSESEYKEWKVPKKMPSEDSINVFREFFGDSESRRFFGYRTTNFGGSLQLHRRSGWSRLDITDVLPGGIPYRSRERRPRSVNRGSSLFRRSLYLNNLWINPLSDVTGRYRESSPELYRTQPALSHRLVPWVNRELAALIPQSRIAVVLGNIMDLIEQQPINSDAFCNAIRHHLGTRSSHFCHEFYNFARSPFDMVGHDNASTYRPRVDISDAESDAEIVEVTSSGEPVRSFNSQYHNFALEPSRVAREETIANDGSVVISSEDSSDADDSAIIRNGRYVIPPPSNQSTEEVASTVETESPLSLQFMISRARNFLTAVDISVTTDPSALGIRAHISPSGIMSEPGPSGISSAASSAVVKTEQPDDSDECLVVDVVQPGGECTPELINVSSQEEEDSCDSDEPERSKKGRLLRKRYTKFELNYSSSSNNSSSDHEKRSRKKVKPKMDSKSNKRVTRSHNVVDSSKSKSISLKKGKRLPCLDRKKFLSHLEEKRKSEKGASKTSQQVEKNNSSEKFSFDHSYCSADNFENNNGNELNERDNGENASRNRQNDGDIEEPHSNISNLSQSNLERSSNSNKLNSVDNSTDRENMTLSNPGCSYSRDLSDAESTKVVRGKPIVGNNSYGEGSSHYLDRENVNSSSNLSTPSFSEDCDSGDLSTYSDKHSSKQRNYARKRKCKFVYDSEDSLDIDMFASKIRSKHKKAPKRDRISTASDSGSPERESQSFLSRDSNSRNHVEKWVCKQRKYSYYYSDRHRYSSGSNSDSNSNNSGGTDCPTQNKKSHKLVKTSEFSKQKINLYKRIISDDSNDHEGSKLSKKKSRHSKSKKRSKDKRKLKDKRKSKEKKNHKSKKKKSKKAR